MSKEDTVREAVRKSIEDTGFKDYTKMLDSETSAIMDVPISVLPDDSAVVKTLRDIVIDVSMKKNFVSTSVDYRAGLEAVVAKAKIDVVDSSSSVRAQNLHTVAICLIALEKNSKELDSNRRELLNSLDVIKDLNERASELQLGTKQ